MPRLEHESSPAGPLLLFSPRNELCTCRRLASLILRAMSAEEGAGNQGLVSLFGFVAAWSCSVESQKGTVHSLERHSYCLEMAENPPCCRCLFCSDPVLNSQHQAPWTRLSPYPRCLAASKPAGLAGLPQTQQCPPQSPRTSNKSSLCHRRRLQLWRPLRRGNLMSWDNSFIGIQAQGRQMRIRSKFRKARWLPP